MEQTLQQVVDGKFSVKIRGSHGSNWEPLMEHELKPEKEMLREAAQRVASRKRGSATMECAENLVNSNAGSRTASHTFKHHH